MFHDLLLEHLKGMLHIYGSEQMFPWSDFYLCDLHQDFRGWATQQVAHLFPGWGQYVFRDLDPWIWEKWCLQKPWEQMISKCKGVLYSCPVLSKQDSSMESSAILLHCLNKFCSLNFNTIKMGKALRFLILQPLSGCGISGNQWPLKLLGLCLSLSKIMTKMDVMSS